MRILITGGNGGLGTELARNLNGHVVSSLSKKELDVTDKTNVEDVFKNGYYDWVIHCAAVVNADYAETHKNETYSVNVLGTENVAHACKKYKCKMVFLSSDYVFLGDKGESYKEDDKVYPINYYGITKILGEQIVRSVIDYYYIVRVQWLFGQSGNTFFHKILRRKDEPMIRVVNDQIGTPTYTRDIACAIGRLIELDDYGIYHLGNEGKCSWAEYAKEIIKISNGRAQICAVSSKEYNTPSRRPAYSVMSKEKAYQHGIGRFAEWQDALYRCYKSMTEKV